MANSNKTFKPFHLIMSVALLILALFLLNSIVQQSFKPYTNCAYLISNELAMPSFFCDGYDVRVLNTTVFSLPGLRPVMDPPLEFVRTVTSWIVIIAFATLSVYLTLIINNLKTVVKFLTFNKQTWINFLAGVRIWLLLFVSFCSLFYFFVIR